MAAPIFLGVVLQGRHIFALNEPDIREVLREPLDHGIGPLNSNVRPLVDEELSPQNVTLLE
jgi:hypothetical protein